MDFIKVHEMNEHLEKKDLLLLNAKENSLICKYRHSSEKTRRLMQVLPTLSNDEREFITLYVNADEKLRTLIRTVMVLGKDLER
jgi:hypothetical protein